MGSQTRYEVIASLLDDPINFAIAQREVVRRRTSLVTPPIPKLDGSGSIFVRVQDWPFTVGSEPDNMAEIFQVTEGWMVLISDDELGPYTSQKVAITEAKLALNQQGHLVLEELPWGQEETKKFPRSKKSP
jgi:hypothetical protein